MKLRSVRTKAEIEDVLMKPGSEGPDPVYSVFTDIKENNWINKTIIEPGNYGGEFPKTYGHYHTVNANETYKLIEGNGLFLMQKKYYENGKWIPNKVQEILIVEVNIGEEITITPEYAHSWSNIGNTQLITYDNWKGGSDSHDYEKIKKLRGLAYYFVKEKDNVKIVRNPNYVDLPQPKWVKAQDLL